MVKMDHSNGKKDASPGALSGSLDTTASDLEQLRAESQYLEEGIAALLQDRRFIVVGGEELSPPNKDSACLDQLNIALAEKLAEFKGMGLTHVAVLASETMEQQVNEIKATEASKVFKLKEKLDCSDRTAILIDIALASGLKLVLLKDGSQQQSEFIPDTFNVRTERMADKLLRLREDAKVLVVTTNVDTGVLPVCLTGGAVVRPLASILAGKDQDSVASLRVIDNHSFETRFAQLLSSPRYNDYLTPGEHYLVPNEVPFSRQSSVRLLPPEFPSEFECVDPIALSASHLLFTGGCPVPAEDQVS